MSEIATKLICLNLNRFWKPIGYKTVKDTIIQLCGASFESEPTALALDIDYNVNEDGEPMFDYPKTIIPVKWDEWVKLPIRSWDLTINSSVSKIRVPTVVVSVNYGKMPMRMFRGKPTKDALWNRDGGICQYTGKSVSKTDANIDHVVPKSRGGTDSWTNLVVSSREINTKKGNSLNSEIGLKLIREPTKPKPTPICDLIKDPKHIDWNHFIEKN
jgi:5-methylcytosine-specific restriction endonuclease McrA